MDLISAILMGILQGATEFLPISSSGHLRLAETFFGLKETELLFDIVLHVGTLIAVCVVYRDSLAILIRDIFAALRGVLGTRSLQGALDSEGVRLALLIVVATLPTGVIGLFLDKIVDGPWLTSTWVGGLLCVNAGILLLSRVAPNLGKGQQATTPKTDPTEPNPDPHAPTATDHDAPATKGIFTPTGPVALWKIGLLSAFLIGVAQGMAVLPGISRSGLTITVCLLLAVEREQAARFSFLLSIPAILGALVLKFDLDVFVNADPTTLLQYGLGALAAALSGYACLLLLIRLLVGARFHHFAWYCVAVGLLAIAWPML